MTGASRRASTTIKFAAKCMHDYPKRFGLFDSISWAHATYQMPWAALTALVPPTQYLFGTDYSAEPIESTVNEIPNLGISRDVLEMLERKNAERLFPRFKE